MEEVVRVKTYWDEQVVDKEVMRAICVYENRLHGRFHIKHPYRLYYYSPQSNHGSGS
jgi:hypothetical protein